MIINEKLIEVISDVIVRRNDHDQYGTKENAIKAFRKRYKNLSDNEYNELYNLFDSVYKDTANIANRIAKDKLFYENYIHDRNTDDQLKEYFEKIKSELKNKYKDTDERIYLSFINWCIFWYILK